VDYFDDVAPRTGPNQCAKCRKELHRADRITEVKIVGGVGSNPTGAGRCLYVCETQEYAHAECANPTLTQQLIEIPRSSLIVDTHLGPLKARTPDFMCCRCRKKLERGDRVMPVILVEGIGRDPDTQTKAVMCSSEYEMVHFDCHDPSLGGKA
jgi:hypothetical protein